MNLAAAVRVVRPTGLFLTLSLSAYAASQNLNVKIIDRQDSSTRYSYVVPGYSNTVSNTDVNCYGNVSVNCSASTRTTGLRTPSRTASYDVLGSTLSLRLPDGRIAVVNCDSKYSPKGDGVNQRSCRIPLVNDIEADFDGNKAKLKWPVSIDGRKFESETYKILALLDAPDKQDDPVEAEATVAKPTPAAAPTNTEVVTVKTEPPSPSASPKGIKVRFTSTPSNAEIDVDGNYWGNTPTADLTRLPPGTHTIIVKKIGYKPWERKIELVPGDDRTVNAELEDDAARPRIVGLN